MTTGRWSPSLRRGTACPIASLASWRDAGGHWRPVAKKEYGRESRKEGGAHGSHSAAHGWATCYAWSFK